MAGGYPDDEDDEPQGFFRKYRVPLIIVGLLVFGAAAWAFLPKSDTKPKRSESVQFVNILPPPPPPTPPTTPPPTPPPVEPEPQEVPEDVPTTQEFVEETAADSPPEEAPPEEAAPMGSNITGDGPPDSFGLVGRGGGGLIGGTGTGSRQGGGSKYGWYAGKVQSHIAGTLRQHRKTRASSMNIKVRIWADSSGRISRAALAGSTGDPDLDRALTDEILTGLVLPEPPPEDMPMPIVMRISARRPN